MKSRGKEFIVLESIPVEPLAAEVVFHVRGHLKKIITSGEAKVTDLALLFGLSEKKSRSIELSEALQSTDPILSAAKLIARKDEKSSSDKVVELGHDSHHVEQCRKWLLNRKEGEEAFNDIVAFDLETLLMLSKAKDLAVTDLPILIEGKTGTGKELLAKAIHEIWVREKTAPGLFQPVQVSGLPPDLVGSELFGHVKGAFTGALKERKGKISGANGGTLLIDEVGDLPPKAQIQLLRFLQDGKFTPLGADQEVSVQVRIISATWHDLKKRIEEGAFRADLFYRLRVGSLHLPPLCKRSPYIPEVVREMIVKKDYSSGRLISRRALDALSHFGWPGNLRELDGVIGVAQVNARGAAISLEDLPFHIQAHYIHLPLEIRAVGAICDLELDDATFNEEALRMIIDRINKVLEQQTIFEPSSHHQDVHAYLSAIPDESEDHIKAREIFDEYLRGLRRVTIEKAREQLWGFVVKQGLPAGIGKIVKYQVVESIKHRIEAEESSDKLKKAFENSDSPWLRLWSEARSLPGVDLGSATGFLLSAVQFAPLLFSFSPGMREAMRSKLKEGGIVALGAELKSEFNESQNDEDEEEENDVLILSKILPKNLSKEEWQDYWDESGGNIAEMVRRTGYDNRTVKKYLVKHRIIE